MIIKKKKTNRPLLIALFASILLVPISWLVTNFNISPSEVAEIIFSIDRFFALKIFLFLVAIVFLVSGKILSSIFSTIFIFALIIVCSSYKVHYLGNPLTVADLIFFFSNISENLVLFKTYQNLGVLLTISLVLISGAVFLMFRKETRSKPFLRSIGFLVAFFLGANQAYAIADKRTQHINVFELSPQQLGGNAVATFFWLAKQNGTPLEATYSGLNLIDKFFLTSSTDFEKPEKIKQSLFQKSAQRSIPNEKEKPDILVVLNESLFNPKLLSQCQIEKEICNNKLFQKQAIFPGIYGPMSVHTHGGGTWLSEFAFLSGYDWRAFGPGGTFAPRNIAPQLTSTIATHLRSLGYRTVAVYPVAGNFLSARKAYEHYGFEEFYDTDYLGISADWRNNADSLIFEKAMNVLNNKADNRPIFLFILTIKNHGPYLTKRNQVDETAIGKSPNAAKFSPPFIDYLTRLRETESATESLRKKWLGTEKPRILAWFGDHQPFLVGEQDFSRPADFLKGLPNLIDQQKKLLTWYEITSNNPQRQTSPEPVATDLAFLSTKILEYAGLPLPSHGNATLDISKRCILGISFCGNDSAVQSYLSFRIWELGEIR